MELINAIKTGSLRNVENALSNGALINNSLDTDTNTLSQTLTFEKNKKFNPLIVKRLIMQGATVMSQHILLAIDFTIKCLKTENIGYDPMASPNKKVKKIFKIIDIVINHGTTRYAVTIPNETATKIWHSGILLVKSCIDKLEEYEEGPPQWFLTLKLFDKFIESKIPIDNSSTESNTLSVIIKQLIIQYRRRGSVEQIAKLLEDLIDLGAQVNQNSGESNTLNLAILTKKVKIVQVIARIALPDISDTNNNSLNLAVKTNKPEIIEEIIMIGGRPINKRKNNTFSVSKVAMTNPRIYDMLICLGMMIPERLFKASLHGPTRIYDALCFYFGSDFDDDLPDMHQSICGLYEYCKLFNGSLKEPLEMRERIINNMNQMIRKSSDRLVKKSNLGNILSIPVCCVAIVHEYYYDQPMRVINWSEIFTAYDAIKCATNNNNKLTLCDLIEMYIEKEEKTS